MATEEKDALQNPKEEENIPAQWGPLLRVMSEFGKNSKFLLFCAIVVTALSGAAFPLFAVFFQQILDALTLPGKDIKKEAVNFIWYFAALGVGSCVLIIGQMGLFGAYAVNVSVSLRERYFSALLQQEIGFLEKDSSGTMTTNMTSELEAIEAAIGVKMSVMVQQTFAFFIGVGIAFYYSWSMTLVLFACMPAMVITGFLQGLAFGGAAGQNADVFVKGGAMSQEVITNIRTVKAFPLLINEKIKEYEDRLYEALPVARKRALVVGAGMGGIMLSLVGVVYAIGIWYGITRVADGHLTIGDMFGCFFGFVTGGMGLGQLGSVLGDVQKGMVAAAKAWVIIDRLPNVRPPETSNAVTRGSIEGEIELNNVTFAYPSNPENNVLERVSVRVRPGQTLAIVGPSGSGKSTIVNLLERYYDPLDGEILIDNERIHNYDLEYLRSQMGVVSQMPLLFDESVAENIRAGTEATRDDIIEAARKADADEFITALPNGYDTKVGEMGGKLSGGQRQRIAIARALVHHPKILLLDEATSALDTKSEREVQRALDKISHSQQHTVIVVAHRLSTIKDADIILVLVDGEVDEQGTHRELIEADGIYAALVRAQELVDGETNDDVLYGDDQPGEINEGLNATVQ